MSAPKPGTIPAVVSERCGIHWGDYFRLRRTEGAPRDVEGFCAWFADRKEAKLKASIPAMCERIGISKRTYFEDVRRNNAPKCAQDYEVWRASRGSIRKRRLSVRAAYSNALSQGCVTPEMPVMLCGRHGELPACKCGRCKSKGKDKWFCVACNTRPGRGRLARARRKMRERKKRGDATAAQVEMLLERAKRCCYCGCWFGSKIKKTIEHFIPLSRGGTNRLSNLGVACAPCNNAKRARLPSEFVVNGQPMLCLG